MGHPPSWWMQLLFFSPYLTNQSLFFSLAGFPSSSWPLNSGVPELSLQIYSVHYIPMWAHLLTQTDIWSSQLCQELDLYVDCLCDAYTWIHERHLKFNMSSTNYFSAHSSFQSVFCSSVDGITIHPVAQSRNLFFPDLSYSYASHIIQEQLVWALLQNIPQF